MNLSDAIQQYLADRHVKGIKPGTIRNDKAVLQLLLADVGNIQTGRLRPQHIDVFWSKRTTWGPGTMNKGRYALASFFKWCQARGHIDRNRDLLEGNRKIRVALDWTLDLLLQKDLVQLQAERSGQRERETVG